jgi:hypothetical protein
MSLAAWKTQFLEQPAPDPKRARVYVCVICGEAFAAVEDHDFDLCAVQYEMELRWRLEGGEVIYAN